MTKRAAKRHVDQRAAEYMPTRGKIDDPLRNGADSILRAVEKGGEITLPTLTELLDLLRTKTDDQFHVEVAIRPRGSALLKTIDNERDAKETLEDEAMTKDEIRQGYIGLLRGMLSLTWQKPSERKLEALLKSVDVIDNVNNDDDVDAVSAPISTENRRRLTALVAAGTKLDTASRLVKEATVDIARSGLIPREHVQKIAADLDDYIRRITTTIELIP